MPHSTASVYWLHIFAYVPDAARSSSWVPSSTLRPPSSTTILSAPTTVESLWAIMITVLPAMSLSKAFWIKCSFSGSENAVASSSTTMGASEMIERAMAIRCCSPPDRCTPSEPITVA